MQRRRFLPPETQAIVTRATKPEKDRTSTQAWLYLQLHAETRPDAVRLVLAA